MIIKALSRFSVVSYMNRNLYLPKEKIQHFAVSTVLAVFRYKIIKFKDILVVT